MSDSRMQLLAELEASQWLSARELRERQDRELEALLRHAWETVPYYREAWGAMPGAACLQALPVLTRRHLQSRFPSLHSLAPIRSHEARTTGSTGAPVRVLKTEATALYWAATTLRDHAWHRRDFSRTLAVIRRGMKPGAVANWGAATEGVVQTGPCVMLDVAADVDSQLAWLERERPGYLLTYPSLVAALAKSSLQKRARIEGLVEVRTLGEALGDDVRILCREAWGVPLTDVYSAEEVGYIALQCPEHAHYHVQSESVLVEVLDSQGRGCAPGEVGRVVVTDLRNFAMPLVRYEIGDYAEPGPACPCGRGLPVLRRIAGRVRNTLVTADGRRYWPTFGQRAFLEIADIRQHQFVQRAYDHVEARLVTAQPLSAEQEARLCARVASRLPAGMRVTVVRIDAIARGAGGKFEDFVSEIAGG